MHPMLSFKGYCIFIAILSVIYVRAMNNLSPFVHKMNLVLGTGSYTRRLILSQRGIPFTIYKADIDEKALGDRSRDANPYDLVCLLAKAKAEAILKTIPADLCIDKEGRRSILLTADQVVVHDNQILEKPADEAEARRFISLYSGGYCSTVGSIALTHLGSKKTAIGVDSATIFFDTIPLSVIDKIMEEGQMIHCAGGLMVEHPLLQPYIKSIDGTQESLMGLSCELLENLLEEILS